MPLLKGILPQGRAFCGARPPWGWGRGASGVRGPERGCWAAVAPFIGDDVPASRGRGSIHTVLFTDMERNTELLQRLGDERWRALLREHERITRAQLAAHGGNEIKTTGDGFMASFASAADALE